MPKYSRSLFVFRRDLRVDDNTGLIEAAGMSDVVVPCFIVDPRQVEDNPYRGEAAVQFMHDSLLDLAGQIQDVSARLAIFNGVAHETISQLIGDENIDAVFINRDYTPFSIDRDRSIENVCKERGAAFHAYDDTLLHAPGVVKKSDGSAYTVFTPFCKRACEQPIRKPRAFTGRLRRAAGGWTEDNLARLLKLGKRGDHRARGGRDAATKILAGIGGQRDYKRRRDFPAERGTTRLSAYLKFGCCSAREAADAIRSHLGRDHELMRQLHWRDFFTQVAYFHPRVFEGPFQEQYRSIEWENDRDKFAAWCEGRTGFPIVDAGMRELEATGYMHNRVRMITASFLTKDFHIDWRWGERHFATRLVDYDPAVNNGSWQWAASTGCDAQPFFRIFNPWLQQKKFDADAEYIKRWIPELIPLSPKDIHNLWKSPPAGVDYPAPLVDHATQARRAKAMYEACRR